MGSEAPPARRAGEHRYFPDMTGSENPEAAFAEVCEAPQESASGQQSLEYRKPNIQEPTIQVSNIKKTNIGVSNLQVSNIQVSNTQSPNIRVLNIQAPNIRVSNLSGLKIKYQISEYVIPIIRYSNIEYPSIMHRSTAPRIKYHISKYNVSKNQVPSIDYQSIKYAMFKYRIFEDQIYTHQRTTHTISINPRINWSQNPKYQHIQNIDYPMTHIKEESRQPEGRPRDPGTWYVYINIYKYLNIYVYHRDWHCSFCCFVRLRALSYVSCDKSSLLHLYMRLRAHVRVQSWLLVGRVIHCRQPLPMSRPFFRYCIHQRLPSHVSAIRHGSHNKR